MKLSKLEQTFLDLADIGEAHPHEDEILSYIKKRLDDAGAEYRQDKAGNIISRLGANTGKSVALVGHVDIAASLGGRKLIVEDDIIKTDGTGLLGGDDKTAVAAMLELTGITNGRAPSRSVELIFTVGEEAGCVGAMALDTKALRSKQALVLDWLGRVNRVATKSPAYYKIDVEYIGRDAHPAHWQDGKNAGAAMVEAVSQLRQGEYAPGVTCNVGTLSFGNARNKVPGEAKLQAELRSYDTEKIESAATHIRALFEDTAGRYGMEAKLEFATDSPAFELNQEGALYGRVVQALASQNLQPQLEPTYGCFDGNILAARGLDVVIMGAGYYNPHSPSEYLNRAEFAEFFEFLKVFVS